MASRNRGWGEDTHCMGVIVRKQCWAGELRQIGRRRGIEEVFFGECPRHACTEVFLCHQSLAPNPWD